LVIQRDGHHRLEVPVELGMRIQKFASFEAVEVYLVHNVPQTGERISKVSRDIFALGV
jgi:hypothetical protein